jgi:hypothetical protein
MVNIANQEGCYCVFVISLTKNSDSIDGLQSLHAVARKVLLMGFDGFKAQTV